MKVFAHRGSSLIWPENTLFAFNQANEYGVTGFETDLCLSLDQEIMLAHDDNLARFGLPDKTVSQLNKESVQEIKISSPDGKYSDNLITLRTLLETYPNKDYIFDCKISERMLFEKLKHLLEELQFHNRIWFLTWSRIADGHVREFFPGYKFFPRENRARLWAVASILGLGRIFEPRGELLSLPAYENGLRIFSKRQIESLKKRGKIFIGYLINSHKDFDHCKQCGVQAYLTDRPDLISTLSTEKQPGHSGER
jgi:glycerophosphoryl diester phosphodiesterase